MPEVPGRARVLSAALFFVLGFATVFRALGATTSFVSQLRPDYTKLLEFDRWDRPGEKQNCLRRLGPWAPDPIFFINSLQ